ncbi:MAG: glycoside hydrolase family 75 protein [Elusimicrobiota bacterium]
MSFRVVLASIVFAAPASSQEFHIPERDIDVPAIGEGAPIHVPTEFWESGQHGLGALTLTGNVVRIEGPMAADSDGAPAGAAGDKSTHQSQTSLTLKDGSPVNADEVNYVVLPLKKGWKHYEELKGVKLGDFCKVTYNGKTLVAIAADKGPGDRSKFGEGSLALLRSLGVKTNGNTGIDSGVIYEFYPGSGSGAPADQTAALAALNQFASNIGVTPPETAASR